jgi:hypothetical protein
LSVLGLAAAVLIGGCGQASAHGPDPVPALVPLSDGEPPAVAATAGGACELLDFGVVAQALGARFDVAAATQQGQSYTCVLQASGASLPDLVLSVSRTAADAAVFGDTVRPDGAHSLKGLGKAAYRMTFSAKAGHGPAVEVGWLSGDGRLITLRYTLSKGVTKAAAVALEPKLITLAKQLDAARV